MAKQTKNICCEINKAKEVYFIPLKDGNGICTGKYLKVKQDSHIYKQIIEGYGGKIPNSIRFI